MGERFSYVEDVGAGNGFRAAYLGGIESYIAERNASSAARREEKFREYFGEGGKGADAYRRDFIRMLGEPLASAEIHLHGGPPAPTGVKEYPVAVDGGYEIARVVLDTPFGVPFYGILFKRLDPDGRPARAPLVLSQHGGQGTPERCSTLFGSSANYNDMTRRLLAYGVHVFAPQLLFWNNEQYGNPFDRRELDRKLKYLGGSMVSLELYCIEAALTWLYGLPYVDAERIGMAGLSYGSSFTLYAAACDTRIRSAVACSFFSDRLRYDWPDVTFAGSADGWLDAEIGLLAAPRGLHILMGTRDPLFEFASTESEYFRLRRYWTLAGAPADKLRLTLFDGVHEFYRGEEPLELLLRDLG